MAKGWPMDGPPICVSILVRPGVRSLPPIPTSPLLELRLDRIAPRDRQWLDALDGTPRVIATCRPGFLSPEDCGEVLIQAMERGVFAIDLELGAPAGVRDSILRTADRLGTRVILSVHDPEGTPRLSELRGWVEECFAMGADLAKIACMARHARDGTRLLSLYETVRRPLVAFCMGETGRFTRFESLRRGAPFLYASAGPGLETAPGQPTLAEALRELRR